MSHERTERFRWLPYLHIVVRSRGEQNDVTDIRNKVSKCDANGSSHEPRPMKRLPIVDPELRRQSVKNEIKSRQQLTEEGSSRDNAVCKTPRAGALMIRLRSRFLRDRTSWNTRNIEGSEKESDERVHLLAGWTLLAGMNVQERKHNQSGATFFIRSRRIYTSPEDPSQGRPGL
jgi:hypothetical protein